MNNQQAIPDVIEAEYTSVFDDYLVCTSKCKYNTVTKTVFDIETADNSHEADDANAMTDEYVVADGHRLSEEDGVVFDY